MPGRDRKARLERQAQIEKATQQRELADLRFQSAQLSSWQSGVQRAVRQTMADQYRNTLIGELDAMINPTQPNLSDALSSAEPAVIEVEQPDEETGYLRLHKWWI